MFAFVVLDLVFQYLSKRLAEKNVFVLAFVVLQLPQDSYTTAVDLPIILKETTVGIPLPLNSQHLSYDDCLEVRRENNLNCSVLCFVRRLCTMICTHTHT